MTAEQFWRSVTVRRVGDFARVWGYPEKFGVLNAFETTVTSVTARRRDADTGPPDYPSEARQPVYAGSRESYEAV
jgi:hypothetical protein